MILSMWTNYYHDLPVEEAVDRIAAAGFRCTELAGLEQFAKMDDSNPALDALKAHCDAQGVTLHQVHGYWGELLPEDSPEWETRIQLFKKEIACAAHLGIKVIVAHPMRYATEDWPKKGPDWAQRTASLERNVRFFRELAPTLEEASVSVGIENMPYNALWIYAEELAELVDAVGSLNVGVAMDTSHLNMSRVNIPQFIHKLDRRLIATHISDNLQGSDRHLMPMFGYVRQGWIDWFQVRDALREIDYGGTFNLETPGEVAAPLEVRDMKIRFIHQAMDWLFHKAG